MTAVPPDPAAVHAVRAAERSEVRRAGARDAFTLVAVQGHAFHKLTPDIREPATHVLGGYVTSVAESLVAHYGPAAAYVHGHDILLAFAPGDAPFSGRLQAVASLLAARATARLNQLLAWERSEFAAALPVFTAHAWALQGKDAVADTFWSREVDGFEAAVRAAAEAVLGATDPAVPTDAHLGALAAAGIAPRTSYSPHFWFGTYHRQHVALEPPAPDVMRRIPPAYHAKVAPVATVRVEAAPGPRLLPLPSSAARVAAVFGGGNEGDKGSQDTPAPPGGDDAAEDGAGDATATTTATPTPADA